MKTTKRTHDFKALELKIQEDSAFPHFIYFKEHSVRDHTVDKPSGRTLFVINVPPYADEKGLTNAFSEAGKVTSVILSSTPHSKEIKFNKIWNEPTKTTFRVGYIVFKKVADLDKALQLTQLRPMNSEGCEISYGIGKWIQQYNNTIQQHKELRVNIELLMKEHDKKSTLEQKQEKLLEQKDNEGWVTVTKGGKVQSFARTEKVENKIMAKEERNKKRKELKNFYTFQIRESKMKHVVALRQKFEEDKKKIAQIKQSRRFKPF